MNKIRLICFAFALSLFLILAKPALAITYGSGLYSVNPYNGAIPNLTTPGIATCSNTVPATAPNLFEIDRMKDMARIYFAPSYGPYNGYFVSYGLTRDASDFAVTFTQSTVYWVISYQINGLKPGTPYFFKVRALNGCAAGDFSDPLLAGSVPATGNTVSKFYKGGPSVVAVAYRLAAIVTPTKQQTSPARPVIKATAVPLQTSAPTQEIVPTSAPIVPNAEAPLPWWQKLLRFFGIYL